MNYLGAFLNAVDPYVPIRKCLQDTYDMKKLVVGPFVKKLFSVSTEKGLQG